MTSQNKLRHEKATGNWCDVLIMSRGGRNSTLSREGPQEVSQSGQSGDRGSSMGTSCRDHGGGGGAGLHDGSAVEDSSSIKAQRVERGASFLLKTELISGSHRLSNS